MGFITYGKSTMYQYDLTSQRDQTRLSLEAELLGREAARTMPLAERSDVIRARAHQLCEQALSESSQLTNDAARYTASFVDYYTDAYFMEIVALLHRGLPSPSQHHPESQSTPP
jgi:hypothetical protein